MSHPAKPYIKAARTTADLLVHLQGKGLAIPNPPLAQNGISRIGYYRLLIYMRPLQDPMSKRFLPGTSFEDILDLYNFDRELRLLCLDAIERIEVALRAAVIEQMSILHGAHFHLSSRHFEKIEGYRGFMEQASRAKYLGITHYYDNYNDPPVPPIWTILEGVTLGALSRMFSQLHKANRHLIASQFKYPEPTLVSWFRSLNNLRNMCAHHNRLWNAVLLVDQPMKTKKIKIWGADQNHFYARAVVMVELLKQIDPALTWKDDLKQLFVRYPAILPAKLGFPAGWDVHAFWV